MCKKEKEKIQFFFFLVFNTRFSEMQEGGGVGKCKQATRGKIENINFISFLGHEEEERSKCKWVEEVGKNNNNMIVVVTQFRGCS